MPPSAPHFLERLSKPRLAYHQLEGNEPGVLFLGGFHSNMRGIKANTLSAWCSQRKTAFTRFDYRGHGESDGKFEDGCITDWLEDTLSMIDHRTAGPIILVGSSMGAWLMLLAAIRRPDRIAGLVGIAAAADFTEILYREKLCEEQRNQLMQDGYLKKPSAYDENPYIYTRKLIEDGRRNLVLDKPVQIECPLRLIHSTDDPDVPWRVSQDIMEKVTTPDVQLTLLKDAGHRLSRKEDLDLILLLLDHLLKKI
ncbi:MAG: alpha/beta hydrolase [Acidiferrobacterales bacterium]|nr:alpha/beta hydrolase [Acidiferrobacterales bacterium]